MDAEILSMNFKDFLFQIDKDAKMNEFLLHETNGCFIQQAPANSFFQFLPFTSQQNPPPIQINLQQQVNISSKSDIILDESFYDSQKEEISFLEEEVVEKEKNINYFKLLQQPNEKQRKSYINENRYILPNPLTIVPEDPNDNSKVEGVVSVCLLYENGEEFGEEKKHLLDGQTLKHLDSEKKAQFALKILETSEGNKFRLKFHINFKLDGIPYQQIITSHPFKVTSNKKRSTIERPRAFNLMPREGLAFSENEVWIKGKNFNDRANILVKFGGHEARIAETEDNILICFAPERPDLIIDTPVEVTITNLHPQGEKISSEKPLVYTYLVDTSSFIKAKLNPTTSKSSTKKRRVSGNV